MSGNVLCGEPNFGMFFTNKLSVGDLFGFETFGKGWLNRVAAVKIKATSMLG
jgi:lysozyme family protein